jgi:hypothetical protein
LIPHFTSLARTLNAFFIYGGLRYIFATKQSKEVHSNYRNTLRYAGEISSSLFSCELFTRVNKILSTGKAQLVTT